MTRQKNDGKGRLGGRSKGTPNKATAELKTWVASILDGGRDRFVESLERLEPGEYVRVFTGLLSYVLPKQAAISPQDAKQDDEARHTVLNITVSDEGTAELLRKLKDK